MLEKNTKLNNLINLPTNLMNWFIYIYFFARLGGFFNEKQKLLLLKS